MLTTKIPHSHDAEEATLGCCLIDGNSEVFNQISPKLELDDFYVEKNRTIWQAMGALVEKGSVIDMVTICDQINDEHIFTDIMRICNRVETSVSVNHYVNILLQKSKLRKIRRGCMTGIDLLDTSEEPEVIIDKINDLATDNRSNKDESHITHTLYEIRDEVQRMASGEYEKEYIKTHLPHLDEKIKLEFGSVMTIAAPTSVGKSALSLNIALRACSKDNFPVLIYSLEMPQKQINKRIIQTLSSVNLKDIEESGGDESKMVELDKAIAKLENLEFRTIHDVGSISQMSSQIKTYVKKHGIKLVVIDYLQLIPCKADKVGRAEAVAGVSQKVKQIALENDIAIILVSQLNREGSRSDSPDLFHLKDSGSIECDSDIVLLMNYKDNDAEQAKVCDETGKYMKIEYVIAKNREAERGVKGFFKFYYLQGRFF